MTDQQEPPPQGYSTSHQPGYGGRGYPGHQGHPGHQEHPGHDKYSIDSGSTGGYVPPPPNYRQQYRLQSIATTTSRPSMDVRDLMEDDNFNSHLALSVFATACCCLPIGVLAVTKSQDARLHYDRGDLEHAHYASMDAKKYAYWAIAVGTIVFVLITMAVIIILSYYL